MVNQSYIKVFVGWLMLLVFAYSITPKIVLHNIVADHVDKNKVLSDSQTEVSSAGIHCKIDNLVAESPFVAAAAVENSVQSFHSSSFFETQTRCSSFAQLFAALRGPPLS